MLVLITISTEKDKGDEGRKALLAVCQNYLRFRYKREKLFRSNFIMQGNTEISNAEELNANKVSHRGGKSEQKVF